MIGDNGEDDGINNEGGQSNNSNEGKSNDVDNGDATIEMSTRVNMNDPCLLRIRDVDGLGFCLMSAGSSSCLLRRLHLPLTEW
jgi:hypothetical protein